MWIKNIGAASFAALTIGLAGFHAPAQAQAPDLRSAKTFAVLGATTVTSTGATTVIGDLGVSPGTAVTGVSGGTVTQGSVYAGGPVAAQAEADLALTYSDLTGRASIPSNNLSGQDLGGMTLTPGVYHFNTSAHLAAPLTLDAQGDSGASFIFQIGTTLVTAANTSVILQGGACANKVFWQVGSSATLSTATAFQGSILAYTSVTLVQGASLNGRALAENGAVTMDTNQVVRPNPCFDLIWQNVSTGDVAYWLMDGAQYVSQGTIFKGIDLNWKIVGEADLNGDGSPDILWQNQATGDVAYWLMNGTQYVSQGTIYKGADLNWKIVGEADLDGDGSTDLIWQNVSTGDVAYWLMNGVQHVSTGYIFYGMDLSWKIVAMADLNGDGSADILWQNQSTGDVAYWLMNGAQHVSTGTIYSGIDLNWKIVGEADLNGDGKQDLLWQNVSTGDVAYWLLNGTQYASQGTIYKGIDTNWKIVAPK